MPIYEYQCNQCQSVFSRRVRFDDGAAPTCCHCQSDNVTRLISAVAVHRSEASRLSGLDPSAQLDRDFYRDRQNIGLWAKKQMQQRGIQPDSRFEEIVEQARSGRFLDQET